MTGEEWLIVIVDDNEDDRDDVRRMLLSASGRRYRFLEAATGADGLRLAGDAAGAWNGPSCLVLDFHLPDMNALEFLEALTGPDGASNRPVLVITGDETEVAGRASLRAGAHDYIGKRWMTPQGLLRTIDSASERFAMARELRQRDRELQSLADNSPDLMTRYDPMLRHVFVNAAAALAMGWPPESICGRSHRDLGLDHAVWEPALRQVFETGRPASMQFSRDPSHVARQYLASLVPEFDAHGAVVTVLCVARDDTDRRAIEQHATDESRRKTDFLATLAHELRNPLAAIRSGLEILAIPTSSGPATEQALGSMTRQLAHLVRLVDDLLEVSRIDGGKIALRRAPVLCGVVLEQAIEASRPMIDAAGHSLSITVPAEPIRVNGDLVRLCQIVTNLLNNAAKYTPRPGHIAILLTCTESEAIVRVRDDGVGLSAQNLEIIFDMYTQLAQADDTTPGGLGLGLPLVRHLAELHGGSVTAASDGPGTGSTFTLRLPLLTSAVDAVEVAVPPVVVQASLTADSRRVLVVDDNEDAALTLALSLSLSGHQTTTAHSGRAGLELMASFRPELALVDIGMPGMSGYEVAEVIRADPTLAGITLVAVTGHGSQTDKERALAAGFDFHLTKPVEYRDVEKILLQRRA